LCQRYYFQTDAKTFAGVSSGTDRVIMGQVLPNMRATPTFSTVSFAGTANNLSKTTDNSDMAWSAFSVTGKNGVMQVLGTVTASTGYFGQLKCDAEI